MKHCKFCDQPMQWGREGDRWIALVPVGMDDGLDRTHQDEDGNLRAKHVCHYNSTVRVTRLDVPVPAHAVMSQAGEYAQTKEESDAAPPAARGRRRKKRKTYDEDDDYGGSALAAAVYAAL